jgi:hypothetical protein
MRILFTFLLLTIIYSASAQFYIDGQIRPRYEFRDGYRKFKDSTSTPANVISQRSRIRFNYKHDSLELKISFQDVHAWGDMIPKKIKPGYVGLHEGWVKFKFKYNLYFQIGKQEVFYDNKRLMTNANWNQIGFTHDAMRLGYKSKKLEIETVFAKNQTSAYLGNIYIPEVPMYKMLNTLWISYNFGKKNKISFLGLSDLRQKNDTVNIDYVRFTGGPILNIKFNDIGIDIRTFYQGGKLQSGQDISAYYLNTDVKFPIYNKSAVVGFELMSGTDATDTANTTSTAFDIMYGTRHKYNGQMDYFSIPSTTKGSGLIDIYATIKIPVSKRVTVNGQWHYFSLQNNYVNTEGNTVSKYLGNEFDMTAKIKFNKIASLNLAYCMIFGSKTLELFKGGDKDLFNSYGYAMLTIKPKLFESK